MSVGTIAQVDPTTLTIALNVRTDVNVNKEFVASIKQLGILQPPMVTPNANGGYDVVLGQRRVLAAVEAGLLSIPVYVVDQSEADAARLVDQLTENDQRQGLSEHERVAGYKQLSLFGVSPAQIAKRTATDRKRVDTALAVAGNEAATAALTEHELTLVEAAYLVEFSDDKSAVKKLVTAAGEGKLDHVVRSLREERELQAAAVEQESLLKTIVGEKHVLPFSKQTWQDPAEPAGLVSLQRLGKPSDPTEPAEPKDIPKELLYGQVIVSYQDVGGQYKSWPSQRFYVLDPEANGIPKKEYAQQVRELTPEQQVAEDERQARWAAEREERAALDAAHQVRRDWLRELLQRKILPDDALVFVARMAIVSSLGAENDAVEYLGLSIPEDEGTTDEDIENVLIGFVAEGHKNVAKLLLAVALATAEEHIRGWGSADVAPWYLPQLVAWGYGLSDAEKSLLLDEEDAA